MVDAMSEPRIIQNMIRTPDGTVLVSGSIHDFKVHKDDNGKEYMVDGGRSYLKRAFVKDDPYDELSLFEGDPHDKIRSNFTWGTRGINGDEPLDFILLKDLDYDHIKAIIETQKHLPEYMVDIFKAELERRNEE